MLYGENVENLCMWKVASEKKPFIDFLRNGFRARFFLTSSETTTTTRGKIFSGSPEKKGWRRGVLCEPKKENFCSSVLQKQSAHTFSCYNVDDDGEVNERVWKI